MNTKKTSSYKKEDSKNNKKTGRSEKYKKKEKNESFDKTKSYSNATVSKKDEAGRSDRKGKKGKKESNKDEEKKRDFNPYYNNQARKYEITCFVCKEEKKVAVEPIDGIPIICDDCLIELEARKLLDQGGAQKTKKLSCKWCGKSFYALNESYLFCDECYDHFSHTIKARGRGFEKYTCDNCGVEGWLHPKTIKDKREKNLPVLCRICLQKEESKNKKEKSKSRIAKVKNRVKKDTDA